VTHSIEGGWTVDELLNGDTNPHVFTYYTNNVQAGGFGRTT
jgi:Neprosin